MDWLIASPYGSPPRFVLPGIRNHVTQRGNRRDSHASAESVHLGVYGGGQWGGFGIRLGGAMAWHDVSTDRGLSFTGFSDNLSASHDARTAQLFGEDRQVNSQLNVRF